ncbi:MAG: hypothetical protein WD119_02150 [Pirellulaceae bacterium]
MSNNRLSVPAPLFCGILALTVVLTSKTLDAAESTTATPRWPFETRIGVFAVHADYDVRGRQPLLDQLAGLNEELTRALQIDIQQETIHLILFRHRHSYRHYMRLHFPDIPDRQALFVRRRGPGMVFAYESSAMETDLRHETTHALLNASLPYVPLWLDEGLAEYFEVPASQRQHNNPHHRLIKLQAVVRRVPDLQSLEAVSSLNEMGSAQYRDAWAWVHFLLHESDESRQVLAGFLQELQAHSPPGSLARRVAAEIPDHKQRFLTHFGL